MSTDTTWPTGRFARVAVLVWSLPVGVAGVVGAFLFALLGWGSLQITQGTLHVVGRGPLARWFHGHGWAAFTLGWTIWFWREDHAENPSIVRHEQAHVRQYLLLGPLMLVAYPLAGLYALARGGHFHGDNEFERDARKVARHRSEDDGSPRST
jgi:hypothetical protein